MASSSTSNKENKGEKDTTSSISITRTRRVSRENQLLHRTRSGGVEHSSSPQSATRKSNLSKVNSPKSSVISDTNMVNDTNTSEDTDEDINIQTNTSVLIRTSDSLMTRAEVLAHFELVGNEYKCKHCNEVKKFSHHSSDANLRKHLGGRHKDLVRNVLFPSQKRSKDQPLSKAIMPINQKRELDDAAIKCIALDLRCFNDFRKEGMQHFLQIAFNGAYKGPCTKTVRSKLEQMYFSYRQDLRAVMSKINYVSLTADMWSNSRGRSYICVTAHVISNLYENIPLLIGFRRCKGSHTAQSIRKYISYELRRSGIEYHRITSITTDNATNFTSAVSSTEFGVHFTCTCHNLNLVVNKGVCLWKAPDPSKFPFASDDDSNDTDVISDGESEMSDNYSDAEGEEEKEDLNSTQSTSSTDSAGSSSATTVSIEDEYSTDEELDDEELDTSQIKSGALNEEVFNILLGNLQVLRKTRNLILFIKNHRIVKDYLRKQVLNNQLLNNQSVNNQSVKKKSSGEVIMDMKTRWYSTFLMLKRFLEHKAVIQTIVAAPERFRNSLSKKQQAKLKKLAFAHDEWELLNTLSSMLEPFCDATVLLSGQYYPTLGLSYYISIGLKKFLCLDAKDSELVCSIKKSLQAQYTYYFDTKVSEQQHQLTLAAAFLDPTVYKDMRDNDARAAKKVIMKLMHDYKTVVDLSLPMQQRISTTTDASGPAGIKEKFAKLCGIFTTTSTSSNIQKPLTYDQELSHYIQATSTADSFNTFWIENASKLPNLANIVRQICAIPATSISSEAAFSLSGYLFRKQRTSLSSKSIRQSMILKFKPFLDKLIQQNEY